MLTRGPLHKFVPPYVENKLAENGIDAARLTIHQSVSMRAKRNDAASNQAMFMEAQAAGAANRQVYDCQNQWQPLIQLVREEGNPATGDDAADAVYESAGIVRDYFKNVLSLNSIDDAGMDIVLNVHFGVSFMNAFWDPQGQMMVFGDGFQPIFTSFTKSLDVIAHELAHGVTQFTANLSYEGESGALNEHFSDVFGSAITQHHLQQDAGQADWLIGDEIMGTHPELSGEALRSMRAPGTAFENALLGRDPQPDHMRNAFLGRPDDNHGVHINSGIPNKAFYLTSMSIGTNHAALVWYHALRNLWPTATFNDAVTLIVDAAQRLTAQRLIPLGSPQAIRSAFKAVGLPY